jgi:hypothetical protein
MKLIRLFAILVMGLLIFGQVYAQSQQQAANTPEVSLVLKPGSKFWVVYTFHKPVDATNGGCVFQLLTPRRPNQSQFATSFNRTNWTKISPAEIECEMVIQDSQASGVYQLTRIYLDLPRGPEFSYDFEKDFQTTIKVRIENPSSDADRPKLDDVRLVPAKP